MPSEIERKGANVVSNLRVEWSNATIIGRPSTRGAAGNIGVYYVQAEVNLWRNRLNFHRAHQPGESEGLRSRFPARQHRSGNRLGRRERVDRWG